MIPKIKEVIKVGTLVISRTVDIDIKRFRTVKTPLRAATRKDIESKRYGPTRAKLENDIVIADYPIRVRKETYVHDELNSFFRNKLLELERLSGELYPYHYIIPYFYPTGELLRKTLSSPNIYRRIYGIMLPLAFSAPDAFETYSTMSLLIPPVDFAAPDFRETIKQIIMSMETYDIQAIPVVDLKLSESAFRKTLNYLIDELGLSVIGLKYRKIRTSLGNYVTLQERYAEKDVLFIMIDTPRDEYMANISNFAVPHLLPFKGMDIIATRLKRPFQGIPEKITLNLKLMNREELRLFPITELKRDKILKLFSDSGITREDPKVKELIDILSNKELLLREIKDISKTIKENKDIRKAYEKIRRLRGITTFQEIKASTKEFDLTREKIRKGEIEEYLRQRRNLEKALKETRQRTLY